MLFQLIIMTIIIFMIGGRLFGIRAHFFKLLFSASLSTVLVTIVFQRIDVDKYASLDQVPTFHLLVLYPLSTLLTAALIFIILDLLQIGESGSWLPSFFGGRKKPKRRFKRYFRLFRILVQNGLFRGLRKKESQLPEILTAIFEQSGGVFVKFGQVLSTRTDILPKELTDNLSQLQENVLPLSDEQVKACLDAEWEDYRTVFREINFTPIAAASIGQTHLATLKTGEKVVVKLLRPDVFLNMESDMSMLHRLISWLSKKSTWVREMGLLKLVEGFQVSLAEETNFDIELRNLELMQQQITERKMMILVPKPYPQWSSNKILVMGFVDGVTVRKAGEILTKEEITHIENVIFQTLLEQILFIGTFHADPHPGNIFIDQDKHVVFLDLGSVGRLTKFQQDAIKSILLGFTNNDEFLMTDGILGICNSPSAEKNKISAALSQLLLETQNQKNSATLMIKGIFGIINENQLALQPMVAAAFRALITLEGTLKMLNPDFSITNSAQHFAKERMNMPDDSNIKAELQKELIKSLPILRNIPHRVNEITKQMEDGKAKLTVGFFEDKENKETVTKLFSLFISGFLGFAIAIISCFIISFTYNKPEFAMELLLYLAYISLLLGFVIMLRVAVICIKYIK
ncbi:AarF/ABC1/UbiB kinase family protein [Listeria grandensis]|uniref:AarF/ABC1/UbiB kinase family protein n=1 Tax=Listeria grandensis TaxID=1494963 RepID=A0A7X1CPP1_9LIST|nr:AarF/UbiB family protein [Listeria grandensis]MBC1936172.1 AarF/ABC1/UbiB kinase family protein [Listeria grandensis]